MMLSLLASLVLLADPLSPIPPKELIKRWFVQEYNHDLYEIEKLPEGYSGPFRYREGATYYRASYYDCDIKEYYFEFMAGWDVLPKDENSKEWVKKWLLAPKNTVN